MSRYCNASADFFQAAGEESVWMNPGTARLGLTARKTMLVRHRPFDGRIMRRIARNGLSGLAGVFAIYVSVKHALFQHVRGLERHHPARRDIGTSSPVFGLRPMRSFLSRIWKVANEDSLTLSPRTMALQISSMTISTRDADSVLESPTLRNTASARSALVTVFPPIEPQPSPHLFSRISPGFLKSIGQSMVGQAVILLQRIDKCMKIMIFPLDTTSEPEQRPR